MSDENQPPKLIVDDDWKSQAQAEKQRLAEKEAEAQAKKDAAGPDGAAGGLPEQIGFNELVQVMATQSLSYMGAFPDPQTGKAMVALDLARLHIDLLSVIEEKTDGNLTEDEAAMLKGTLHELRTQFVEITKYLQQAAAEGKLEGMSGGPGGPGGPAGGMGVGMPGGMGGGMGGPIGNVRPTSSSEGSTPSRGSCPSASS
jgi:hypothetical protein